MKINVRMERKKLISSRKQEISIAKLEENLNEFQLVLRNRFSALEEEEMEAKIMEVVKKAAEEVASKPRRPKDKKFGNKTRKMMMKQKELKQTELKQTELFLYFLNI